MDRRLEGKGVTRWPAGAAIGRLIPRKLLVTSPRSESVGEPEIGGAGGSAVPGAGGGGGGDGAAAGFGWCCRACVMAFRSARV
jgi:hypothetical protein